MRLGAPWRHLELTCWIRAARSCGRPVVYVQLGRLFDIPAVWPLLVDVLVRYGVYVVASVDRMDGEVGNVPSTFFVRDHVPQGSVMEHCDAVIATGNTSAVLGAIAHGLPMLLLPGGGEQPDVAERCRRAGAAVCVRAQDVTLSSLEPAVHRVLEHPALRSSAEALRAALLRQDGCATSAALLEELCRS